MLNRTHEALFGVMITIHKKPGELDLLVNARNANHAAEKVHKHAKQGTLRIPVHFLNAEGQLVSGTERTGGIVERMEVGEIHHSAHPARFALSYNGRRLLDEMNAYTPAALERTSAYSAGWQAASASFSSKAKTCEAKLKTALKHYNGTHADQYEAGFRRQWERLQANFAKKQANKPARKTRRKAEPMTAAACVA